MARTYQHIKEYEKEILELKAQGYTKKSVHNQVSEIGGKLLGVPGKIVGGAVGVLKGAFKALFKKK